MSAELREGQLEYSPRRFPTEGTIFHYEMPVIVPPERREIEAILKAIPMQLDMPPEVEVKTVLNTESVPPMPLFPFGHSFSSLFALRQQQLHGR